MLTRHPLPSGNQPLASQLPHLATWQAMIVKHDQQQA
jgi:hypothetical protein